MIKILELFYNLKDKKFPDNSEIFKNLNNEKSFAALTFTLENDINNQTFIAKNDFTLKNDDLDLYFKFIRKECKDYDILYNEFKTWGNNQLEKEKRDGIKYTKIDENSIATSTIIIHIWSF